MARDLSRGWISRETRDRLWIAADEWVDAVECDSFAMDARAMFRDLLDSLVLDGEPEIEYGVSGRHGDYGVFATRSSAELFASGDPGRHVRRRVVRRSPWLPVSDDAEEQK